MALKRYLLCLVPPSFLLVKNNRVTSSSNTPADHLKEACMEYSWDEIERITYSFSKEVAKGGTSTVFMGTKISKRRITQKPSMCAVKILLHSSLRSQQEFMQEYLVLSRISHPNIVSLHGYCNSQEKRALVMDYYENGTLYGSLKAKEYLVWNDRMRIALQIASALEYLHCKCEPCITHADIKSSNILLDSHNTAILCDFGSSINVCQESGTEKVIVKKKNMNKGLYICGSPGYLDPCYLRSGLKSIEGDVYSFGVLLAELLSGMEAFDENRNPKLLSVMVGSYLGDPDKVLDIVDKRILCELGQHSHSTSSLHVRKLQCVGRLAHECMNNDPLSRPSMSHVVHNLSTLQ